jgi:raffinose/stachyose/melibiose transport system substrate-binding protein
MKRVARSLPSLVLLTLGLLILGLLTPSLAQTVTMYAGPYSPTEATTVTAANPRVVTALQVLADDFEKQTGIKIEFVNPAVMGADNGIDRGKWEAYMQSSIAADNAPDIIYVPQGPDQSGKGWFLALDDLYAQPNPFAEGNEKWSDLFYPRAVDRLQGVGGKSFIIPFAANYPYIIIGTFYNQDLMNQAAATTLPTTWEEWMAQLAQIQEAGIAPMAPFPAEAQTGSVWPMWSTLVPPFTAHLIPQVDTDTSGELSPLEIAQAVKAGIITMDDEHLREAWRQYKRQLGYYLPGWNAADIQAAWNEGKVAQKYGGFWEIYSENSNTARQFEWGFFPTLPVTTETSELVTWTPKLAPTGEARLEGIDGAIHQYAIVKSSVERNNNLEAITQWLQFITTPEANEFVVNENPDAIPGVRGASPDPLWNQLADLPVPDFGPTLYPFAIDQEQQSNLQREVVVWALGEQTDDEFFAAVQKDMLRAAEAFLASQ